MKHLENFENFNESESRYSEEGMKKLSHKEVERMTRNIDHYGKNIHQRALKELKRRKTEKKNDEINEDWGGSDQSIMNQSIHKDLGEPKEFPGFDKVENAAESAVDFYWYEWPEYITRKKRLIGYAISDYLKTFFPNEYRNYFYILNRYGLK